jgi:hypothetical protein
LPAVERVYPKTTAGVLRPLCVPEWYVRFQVFMMNVDEYRKEMVYNQQTYYYVKEIIAERFLYEANDNRAYILCPFNDRRCACRSGESCPRVDQADYRPIHQGFPCYAGGV